MESQPQEQRRLKPGPHKQNPKIVNYYKLPPLELVAAMAKGLLSGGDMIYDPSVARNVAILADHAYKLAQAVMGKHIAELNAAGWDIDDEGYHIEIKVEPEEAKEPTELDNLLTSISLEDFITREQVLEYLGQLMDVEVREGRAAKDVRPVACTVLRNAINDLYNIADAAKEAPDADESQ